MSDCNDKPTDMRGTQVKHISDEVVFYADLTEALSMFPTATTITAVSVSCSDDPLLNLGTPQVITASTQVPWFDSQGRVVQGTIAANKGAAVLVSGGTAQEEDDVLARVLFSFTLSSGEVINRAGRLRVDG